MVAQLLLLALAVDPAPKTPLTLALPGLNAVNLAAGEGDLYAELIAQKFAEHGVKVMSARDLSTMLGVERQKQLLGCSENSCVVELTAALGADGVLVGDLGKLGDEYALNLKVLSSRDGSTLALHNSRAAGPKELPQVMENSVRALLRALSASTSRAELLVNTEPLGGAKGPSLRAIGVAPLAVGAVAIGAGVVLQVVAGNTFADLSGNHYPEAKAAALKGSGQGLESAGNVALIGGGVALVAGLVMVIAGGEGPAPVVAISPQGAFFGIAGVLP